MNTIEYAPVTSAESLLGDENLLPSNGSRPMVMSCDEYVNYVDELLAQQVPVVIQTFNASILHTYIHTWLWLHVGSPTYAPLSLK